MNSGNRKFRAALAAAVAVVSAPALLRAQAVLFDATKAEMAANADWVIDADNFNLGVNSSTHQMTLNSGTESNPQRVPTPAASGITAATPETYWSGAISTYGVTMVKRGYSVESLPYNGSITYGSSANAQDLSHYKVFVVDEPNIAFTATEKTAIINWVHDGGGLMMISDHITSDRNNDGIDSPQVWNDLLNNNTVQANPFGIQYNLNNINTVTSSNTDPAAGNPLISGPAGTVTSFAYHDGATMTLNTAANASARAAVLQTAGNNATAMAASATYGFGRVAAIGDSSPVDDGTGDSGDSNLFDGWNEASDGVLMTNASIWLANNLTPIVWKGTSGATWDTTANWSTMLKPTTSMDAAFISPLPATGGIITLTAGETAQSLSFDESYRLTGGSLALSGGVIAVAATKTATITSTLSTTGTITKSGAGVLEVTNMRVPALSVVAGSVRITPSGGVAGGVSRIPSITIAAGAKMDLTDNKLVTASAIGTWTGSAYTGVTGLIASGRNGGNWGGSGIVTSQSTATTSNLTTLGVATASQVKGIAPTSTVVWAGQTVTGSDTLVMYTYGGDANLDGKINVDDYTRIDFNVPLGTRGWYNGDFNYDGKINVDDYTIIDFNVGIQGSQFFSADGDGASSVTAVPEPTGVALLALGGFSLVSRRRRAVSGATPISSR